MEDLEPPPPCMEVRVVEALVSVKGRGGDVADTRGVLMYGKGWSRRLGVSDGRS